MGERKAFSSEEFLSNPKVKELQDEHKKAFGTAIQKEGYPDMGSGVYSQLLPYTNWVTFNNAQRAHYNMIEQTGPLCATIAAVGLFYPCLTGALGVAYAIGRVLYAHGYRTNKGANGRVVGVIIVDVTLLSVYIIAIYLCFTKTNIVDKIKAFAGK